MHFAYVLPSAVKRMSCAGITIAAFVTGEIDGVNGSRQRLRQKNRDICVHAYVATDRQGGNHVSHCHRTSEVSRVVETA